MLSEMEVADRISADLLAAGLRRGGVALVHSSLSKLGWVPGGPETVIQGLLGALGPEGTLLLPTLTYDNVGAFQTTFDVRNTPCCVGAIPEHFRKRPGSLRSMHPTHSVAAVGPLAAQIVADHQLDDTPVGEHSPFRKLRDLGGQIVFLGSWYHTNTSMHGVEELARPPYLLGDKVEYDMIDVDGKTFKMSVWHHAFGRYKQRYEWVWDLLEPGVERHEGPVLEGKVYIEEAAAVWREGLAALQRDPLYFVELT